MNKIVNIISVRLIMDLAIHLILVNVWGDVT